MTRSHAVRISAVLLAAATLGAAVSAARDDADDLIKRGRREQKDGRYAEAESSFARAAAMAAGRSRAEALFLQAGLVRSGSEAESIYRRLIDSDPDGEYAAQATLELAKIEFATGRYEGARNRLRDAGLCDRSDDACLFEGMASIMLDEHDAAVAPLEHVRRGRVKTWAAFALAEADEGAGRTDEACRGFEALARARVSPAAWYRYAECIERGGNAPGARREYAALAEAFPQTPEAVRAAEKLAAASAPAPVPAEASVPDETAEAPRGAGFTVQFGSFSDRANAIKLASRIKKTHPNVRIDSELVNFREVFRVRYGHYPTRQAAQSAGDAMARDLGEQFTIMPVAPTTP